MSGRTDSGAHPMTGPADDPHPDVRSHLRDDVPAGQPAGPPPGPPAGQPAAPPPGQPGGQPAGPPPGAFDGPDAAPAPLTSGPPGAFDGPPVPADAGPADPGPAGTARHADGDASDPRWARLAGDFVDEPQQAVDAARRMVRDAVEALLADVDPGVDGAGGATRAADGDGSDTERLRQAFRRYRELHTAVARL